MVNWRALGSFLLMSTIVPPPLVSQTTPAPGENLVEMPAGAIYSISERGDAVRVPLTLHGGIAVSDLDQPVLFDIAFGKDIAKFHNTALLSSFRPSLASDGALLIAVALDPPLRQGSYEVRLQLRLKGEARAKFKPMQELALQLVQPAAQLRPPATLVIQRVLGLPGFTADSLVAPPLPLKENSDLSRLAGIDLSQVNNFASDAGQAASCMLKFQEVPTIPSGKSAWASYEVQCDPPVGILRGVAQVRAAELASPVDVNIEIHTRRTRWWIGLIAAAGLLTGYFTRIALPLWASRDQARAQGVNLLAQIDAEMGRRKDAQFQQDSVAIRAALAQVLKSNPKPDVVTQAITKASSDLTKALADLQVRRATAQAKVDQLAKLGGTSWSLPPAIQGVLDTVRPNLVDARAALLADDAQKAVDVCEAARVKLASDLRRPLQTWQDALFSLLDALDTAPVPSSMTSGLKASVERVRGLVNSVGDPGPDPPIETITQALSATDIARMAIRELLLQMQRWPQDTLTDVAGTLRPAPLVDSKAVDGLESTAQRLLNTLRKAAEDPEATAPELESALESLDQAWRGALLAQINDPAQKASIQASLDQGKYSAAAREVAQRLAAVAPGARAVAPAPLQSPSGSTSASAALWTGITGMSLQPRDTIPTAGWWNVDLSPGQIPALAARTAQESKVAQLVQTLVAGVGIVLVSYLANGDKFVGTFADMAGIFSWAFVSDITIDALVAAAKGVKKS